MTGGVQATGTSVKAEQILISYVSNLLINTLLLPNWTGQLFGFGLSMRFPAKYGMIENTREPLFYHNLKPHLKSEKQTNILQLLTRPKSSSQPGYVKLYYPAIANVSFRQKKWINRLQSLQTFLICKEKVAGLKEYNPMRHYSAEHAELYDKYKEEEWQRQDLLLHRTLSMPHNSFASYSQLSKKHETQQSQLAVW